MMLQGVFCPVITPFENGRISLGKFASNLEKFNATKLDGYVLFGSTGEAPYVDVDERLALIKAAREVVPQAKKLIVGTGFEATEPTIDFTQRAADLGADFALVLTPNYYKKQMSDAVLSSHYSDVADRSPIPVILYNVPPFTGVDMPVATVEQLAAHPNIVGIKDSTADMPKLLSLIASSSTKLSILVGNALYYPSALMAGAQGAILAAANVMPSECSQIFANHRERNHGSTGSLFVKLSQFAMQIISPYGIPAIKAAMDMRGYFGGDPRKPLLPVSASVKKVIASHLKKLEFI